MSVWVGAKDCDKTVGSRTRNDGHDLYNSNLTTAGAVFSPMVEFVVRWVGAVDI